LPVSTAFRRHGGNAPPIRLRQKAGLINRLLHHFDKFVDKSPARA